MAPQNCPLTNGRTLYGRLRPDGARFYQPDSHPRKQAMLEHVITKLVMGWIERGRSHQETAGDGIYVLRYGRRFKLMQVFNLAVFVFFTVFGIVCFANGVINPRLFWIG